MAAKKVQPPADTKQRAEKLLQVLTASRRSTKLFPEKHARDVGTLVTLHKAIEAATNPKQGASNQGAGRGEKPHPFDYGVATQMMLFNVHHSTCINAKVQATVGLGHWVEPEEEPQPSADPLAPPPKPKPKRKKPSKVSLTLDPLCKQSWPWLLTLTQIAQDHFSAGTGYLEVVRDAASMAIRGLHYLPAQKTFKVLEDDEQNYHFIHRGAAFTQSGKAQQVMAAFGDSKRLMEAKIVTPSKSGTVSEVIEFPEVSALSRWYGFPSWLAATASIELVQALMQHQFDFHQNRGVPEFLLFFLGSKIIEKDWEAIEEMLQSHAGMGNSGRSSALNLTDPALKVQVERMNMEGITAGSFFKDMSETLAVYIVSAHRVPPTLVGITLPGKMGAANEMSNAIMAFQALVIGPAQTVFQAILGGTLGSPAAGLGLTPEDFEFKTIVNEMKDSMESLQPADTMARMKQSLPAATAEGRKLETGLKKGDEISPEMARVVLEQLLLKLLDG